MTPHQAWRTWTLQPAVIVGLVAATWAYARGIRALWRGGPAGRGVRRWQVAAFGTGLVTVAVALISPLDAAADHLLSAHMAQHLLLLVVAGPLLVLGSPALAMSQILPREWRAAAHRMARRRTPRFLGRTLTVPLVAWLVSTAVVWAWHVPLLYDAPVDHLSLHVLEHASFLATSLLFWWVALQPNGPRRVVRGLDVLYVFAGALQSGALGALIAFAASPIYPLYARRTAAWGTSALADQQLAGLLMWIPSFLVYLVAAGGLFVGWLRAAERDARRAEGRSHLRIAAAPPGRSGGV